MKATKFKTRRVGMGLLQHQVSQRTGISVTRISLLENELVEPKAEEIEALRHVLGAPEDLFPEKDAE